MELLDITLTRLQRRNRVAFVARDAVGADLLTGDAVVLRDDDGEYYAGTVLDEAVTGAGDGAGVRYVVKIGVRLPEEYAMKRARRTPARRRTVTDDDGGMQELLDLLGEARAMLAPRRVPAQRLAR